MKNILSIALLSALPILIGLPTMAGPNLNDPWQMKLSQPQSQLWQTYDTFGYDSILEATAEVEYHEVELEDSDDSVQVKIQFIPVSLANENGASGYAKMEFTSRVSPHTSSVTGKENYEKKFTIYAGYGQSISDSSFSNLDILGINLETRVFRDKH